MAKDEARFHVLEGHARLSKPVTEIVKEIQSDTDSSVLAVYRFPITYQNFFLYVFTDSRMLASREEDSPLISRFNYLLLSRLSRATCICSFLRGTSEKYVLC